MTPGLTFEEQGHIYRKDGKQVPSLTHVLGQLGFNGKGGAFFTENSRQLGTAVHTVREMVDRYCISNELDEALEVFSPALHPDLVPYLSGWLLFRKEQNFQTLHSELPIYSASMQVAGALDIFGKANGIPTIVDTKTWRTQGQRPKRSAELQLAGYALMLAEQGRLTASAPDTQRWVVALPGNGKYRLFSCTNISDFGNIRACLMVWHELHSMGVYKLTGDPGEESEEG